MAENEYFKAALSDFAFDAACGGQIRHLARKGYTVRQIRESLDFLVPFEKVGELVWNELLEAQTILLEEPQKGAAQKEIYVQERGKYGKTSFRRVVVSEKSRGKIDWKETVYAGNHGAEAAALLNERCLQNGRETAYISCDFGLLKYKAPEQYTLYLDQLEERQREYIAGLPWKRQRVYHRMDMRMAEITTYLLRLRQYGACCYFMELGEKIVITER